MPQTRKLSPAEGLSPEEMLMLESITRYSERVQQLEAENGAYNHELVEELIGLGQAYYNMGNYTEALGLYNRALHINRVNEGLHNINQLPIVELIIEANTALKDYKKLSDNFGYLLWVYNRNFEIWNWYQPTCVQRTGTLMLTKWLSILNP